MKTKTMPRTYQKQAKIKTGTKTKINIITKPEPRTQPNKYCQPWGDHNKISQLTVNRDNDVDFIKSVQPGGASFKPGILIIKGKGTRYTRLWASNCHAICKKSILQFS